MGVSSRLYNLDLLVNKSSGERMLEANGPFLYISQQQNKQIEEINKRVSLSPFTGEGLLQRWREI
jgi:hypothetical protein